MEPLGEDGDGGDNGGIFPEHPSPILHTPMDNISRKVGDHAKEIVPDIMPDIYI